VEAVVINRERLAPEALAAVETQVLLCLITQALLEVQELLIPAVVVVLRHQRIRQLLMLAATVVLASSSLR
jgi:hypothetical protein